MHFRMHGVTSDVLFCALVLKAKLERRRSRISASALRVLMIISEAFGRAKIGNATPLFDEVITYRDAPLYTS